MRSLYVKYVLFVNETCLRGLTQPILMDKTCKHIELIREVGVWACEISSDAQVILTWKQS